MEWKHMVIRYQKRKQVAVMILIVVNNSVAIAFIAM
jgi:hypothetical protein